MTTQPGNPNRRKNLRYPIIVLKIEEGSERQPLFGYARDISRGGLFIESINPRKPGDRYQIRFTLPEKGFEVRCRCEVVWMREYKKKAKLQPGYGVRFLDLPDDVAQRIDRWVGEQSAR